MEVTGEWGWVEEERVTSGEEVEEQEEMEEGEGVSSRGGGISTMGRMVTRTQAEATKLGGYLANWGEVWQVRIRDRMESRVISGFQSSRSFSRFWKYCKHVRHH